MEYKRQVVPTERYTLLDFIILAKIDLSKLEKILEEGLSEGGSHAQISTEFEELYKDDEFKKLVKSSLSRLSHLGYLINEKFPEKDLVGLKEEEIIPARVEVRKLFEKYDGCFNVLKEYLHDIAK